MNPNAEKWAFQVTELTKEKPSETVDALSMDELLTRTKARMLSVTYEMNITDNSGVLTSQDLVSGNARCAIYSGSEESPI